MMGNGSELCQWVMVDMNQGGMFPGMGNKPGSEKGSWETFEHSSSFAKEEQGALLIGPSKKMRPLPMALVFHTQFKSDQPCSCPVVGKSLAIWNSSTVQSTAQSTTQSTTRVRPECEPGHDPEHGTEWVVLRYKSSLKGWFSKLTLTLLTVLINTVVTTTILKYFNDYKVYLNEGSLLYRWTCSVPIIPTQEDFNRNIRSYSFSLKESYGNTDL
ncbi:hypothetical protein K435DRAFT_799523 [Dendrothele bispora CBS 962.96]|uniref:Uncharacterized protein n=1 Tax=Dendrothele bispora (strain CBS 962.96) TaxID=1314807 RepID=A0A4S8LVK7_DENBC|nr:hypothetical protein K435DRAFT_799523 [Dendrothele bispora CBS 962.96]